jgi:hypothetical protein
MVLAEDAAACSTAFLDKPLPILLIKLISWYFGALACPSKPDSVV